MIEYGKIGEGLQVFVPVTVGVPTPENTSE
jgi:hypothetical protein